MAAEELFAAIVQRQKTAVWPLVKNNRRIVNAPLLKKRWG